MSGIVIVPYRNRAAHLAQFLSHMAINYPTLQICVVEQYEHKPFNRGKLLNIGFLENPGYKQYIFHDVDMLPISVNYTIKGNSVPVVQLASSSVQLFDYLGGVTRFSKTAFAASGGYNNNYYHRAEDNEMMFNLKRLRINVINKYGEYKYLPHERKGPEFDPALWELAQQKREVQNQLVHCLYTVEHGSVFGKVKHLTVAI